MGVRKAVHRIATLAALAVLVAGLTAASASAQEPTPGDSTREWNIYTALYFWLAGVDGTVAVGPLLDIPVEVPFGEIIDNVDIGFSLHLEVQQDEGLTFLGDLFYVDLSFTATDTVSESPLTFKQQQIFVEGAVGYHVAKNWEILGAVRYYDLSVSAATSTSESDERSAGWVDVFGGVRFLSAISDRLSLAARADVGAGGSSFAWFLNAGAFYSLSDLVWLSGGYRAVSVDYEDGSGRDTVRWDMVTHGLFFGVLLTP